MEWYGPLTILPAIGLIIISTANFIVALNNEIQRLQAEQERNKEIIKKKVIQLKRLSIGISLLYSSVLFFLFASLAKIFADQNMIFNGLMVLGVIATTLAIIVLLIQALKAIYIRQRHLRL
ncbi:MAG: hypothetical protein K9I94_10115 [Bacteroidales bacterium]|nr:hypothetical protein [Bacteroidales bacterium]